MMRKSVPVFVLIVLIGGIFLTPTAGKTEKIGVIMVFKEHPDPALVQAHGGDIKYQYGIIPGIAAYLPVKAVEALRRNPVIDYIEYDVTLTLYKKPANPGDKGKGNQKATVTLSTIGPGSTDPSPGTYDVKTGKEFKATANPDSGASFIEWKIIPSGENPYSITDPSLSLTINVDTEITAHFESSTPPPSTPDPPSSQPLPWGVDRIDAEKSWYTSRGEGVKVAILDTGIDKDHPDLSANIAGGRNFVPDYWFFPPDPDQWDDDHGHGTWVSGIVAAQDNSIGVIGVAPEASLYGVKVLNYQGSGQLMDIIAGIDWCVQNGMDVISMSFGGPDYIMSMEQAVNNAYGAGLVLVAAAGNEGDGNPYTDEVAYPAKYYGAIAVAATAQDDSSPTFSAEGPAIEVAAPGVNINSTAQGGGYEAHSGTSGACPHVTGTVALLLSIPIPLELDTNDSNEWEPIEVRLHLQDTADDLGAPGDDYHFGNGIVDAEEAATGTQS